MTNLKLTALIGTLTALPLAAMALTPGDTVGTTEAEVRAALEAQGATVLEFEIEEGEMEVEYLLDGVEYEAEIDPATGAIIEIEVEDADDDEDDDDDA